MLASLINSGYPYAGASAAAAAAAAAAAGWAGLLLHLPAAAALLPETRCPTVLFIPTIHPRPWHVSPTRAGEWFEAKAQPGEHLEPLDEQRAVVVANLWCVAGRMC